MAAVDDERRLVGWRDIGGLREAVKTPHQFT